MTVYCMVQNCASFHVTRLTILNISEHWITHPIEVSKQQRPVKTGGNWKYCYVKFKILKKKQWKLTQNEKKPCT